MSLPNLSFLTLDIATRNPNKRGADQSDGPNAKRIKDEVEESELERTFNLIFNNCAAYALNVFEGFARCPGVGGFWLNDPRGCEPLPNTDAVVPNKQERDEAVSIFLKGIPETVTEFQDLLALVQTQTQEFDAFVLSTEPNKDSRKRLIEIRYHAMIGLLFKDARFKEGKFGVTFGAYPKGNVTEGSCGLQSGSCKNNMVVVLGDQIAVCSRDEFPRQMKVRLRVPGDAIRKQLVEALKKLSGTKTDIKGVGSV